MFIDKLLEFADSFSIVANATVETPAPNSVDLNTALDDLGAGETLYVVILIRSAVEAAGGAANVTFSVVDDDNEALSSPKKLISSDAIAKGTLVAGYRLYFKIPHTTQRFLGITFTPDTNNLTAGTFSAFITPDVPLGTIFPAGSVVA